MCRGTLWVVVAGVVVVNELRVNEYIYHKMIVLVFILVQSVGVNGNRSAVCACCVKSMLRVCVLSVCVCVPPHGLQRAG